MYNSETKAAHDVSLTQGEFVIETWHPVFFNFVIELTAKSFITSLFFNPGNMVLVFFPGNHELREALGLHLFAITFMISAVCYIIIFDDWSRWTKNKDKCWVLTNMHFTAFDRKDSTKNISVALSEIRQIKTFLSWRLFVQLYRHGIIKVMYTNEIYDMRLKILKAQNDLSQREDY